MNRRTLIALAAGLATLGLCAAALAQPAPMQPPAAPPDPFGLPAVSLQLGGGEGDWVGVLRILALLTVMTLAPAILLTMTSFTRIIIVFSFLRQALGTQQSPPNQVMVALALFLSVFIMQPVWSQVHTESIQPYVAGEIGQDVALDRALTPIRGFMFSHTRQKDLALFIDQSGEDRPRTRREVGTMQLIPAYVLSELKTAFQMGFMLYIPFLVLDMVVASILMAMGMMMLPPILISLPFKIMLFVLVDGWNLLVGSLVASFA